MVTVRVTATVKYNGEVEELVTSWLYPVQPVQTVVLPTGCWCTRNRSLSENDEKQPILLNAEQRTTQLQHPQARAASG